jgi:hypothetical protein
MRLVPFVYPNSSTASRISLPMAIFWGHLRSAGPKSAPAI